MQKFRPYISRSPGMDGIDAEIPEGRQKVA